MLRLPLVLFAVTVLVFGLSRVGGSPIAIYLEHDFTQEQVEALEERYGVDDPLPVQYVAWLGRPARRPRLVRRLGRSRLGGVAGPVRGDDGARALRHAVRGALRRVARHLRRRLTEPAGPRDEGLDGERREPAAVLVALLMLILFYVVVLIVPVGRFDEDVYSQIVHFTGFYSLDAVLNLNGAALVDSWRHRAPRAHSAPRGWP